MQLRLSIFVLGMVDGFHKMGMRSHKFATMVQDLVFLDDAHNQLEPISLAASPTRGRGFRDAISRERANSLRDGDVDFCATKVGRNQLLCFQ